MKRKMVLLLSVAMSVLCFAGCNSGPSDAPSGTARTEKAQETGAEKEKTDETAGSSAGADEKTELAGGYDYGDVSNIKIGMLFDNCSVEARIRQRDKMQELADELGFTLLVQDAQMDETAQMQQGENLLSKGVDVMMIMAVNYEAINNLVKDCNAEGIPVICYGRLIYDVPVSYMVGSDNTMIGHMESQYLLDLMKPEPENPQNWIILAGPFTDSNCSIWYDDWFEDIQPYIDNGSINIVGDSQVEAASTEIAMKLTENFLTACNDDVDVILAVSDSIATGAAQAMAERGLLGKVAITGLDAEAIVLKRIAEGTQSMTISMRDFDFAAAAIDTALKVASGKEGDIAVNGSFDNNAGEVPAVLVEPEVITRDNLYEKIIVPGYASLEEVYADVPKDQWPVQ